MQRPIIVTADRAIIGRPTSRGASCWAAESPPVRSGPLGAEAGLDAGRAEHRRRVAADGPGTAVARVPAIEGVDPAQGQREVPPVAHVDGALVGGELGGAAQTVADAPRHEDGGEEGQRQQLEDGADEASDERQPGGPLRARTSDAA